MTCRDADARLALVKSHSRERLRQDVRHVLLRRDVVELDLAHGRPLVHKVVSASYVFGPSRRNRILDHS